MPCEIGGLDAVRLCKFATSNLNVAKSTRDLKPELFQTTIAAIMRIKGSQALNASLALRLTPSFASLCPVTLNTSLIFQILSAAQSMTMETIAAIIFTSSGPKNLAVAYCAIV